jgi:membrane-associated phospholipid phosphatase
MGTTVEAVATERRPVLIAGGLGCLALVVLLGLAVGPGDTGPDRLAQRSLGGRLHEPPSRRVLAVLASESRWPHAAYALALLPVALAGGLAAADRGFGRRKPSARRPVPVRELWWLALGLGAVPLQHLLRLSFDRAGPRMAAGEATPGAYPSGAALLVALGWGIGGTVAARLRPRWRPFVWAGAAVALGLHGAARVAAHKHWATDILGAYLLAAGVLLVAAGGTPAPPAHREEP